MKSCNLLLLCSSSAAKRHGKSEMTCWTHLVDLSNEDLQRYRITSLKIMRGNLSPRKSIALSMFLLCFPPNALPIPPIPPDTTTAATSAAGMFSDSTKPRALWPKDGPTDDENLGNILVGPLPFITLIIVHKLSNRFHHFSSITSSSFVIGCLPPRRFLEMK